MISRSFRAARVEVADRSGFNLEAIRWISPKRKFKYRPETPARMRIHQTLFRSLSGAYLKLS